MGARQTAQTVEQYVDLIRQAERLMRTRYPESEEHFTAHITTTLTGDPRYLIEDTSLDRLRASSPATCQKVVFAAYNAAVRRLWQQSRITYDIDPDLWAELGDTDPDVTIPPALFSRLPHPDPFVALPEPLVLPLEVGTRQRIDGFFVRGHADVRDTNGAIQVSTHHPQSVGLGLLVCGVVEDLQGRPVRDEQGTPETVLLRLTLDPRAGDGTVAAMINHVADRVQARAGAGGVWDDDMSMIIHRVVSVLVYLCASNADLRPVAKPVLKRQLPRGGNTKTAVKPAKVVAVGYRVGAALRQHRAAQQQGLGPRQASGQTKRPHVRRGHWHTYRVGPGRTGIDVKWLAPIPVGLHGPAGETTVIKVPPRRA